MFAVYCGGFRLVRFHETHRCLRSFSAAVLEPHAGEVRCGAGWGPVRLLLPNDINHTVLSGFFDGRLSTVLGFTLFATLSERQKRLSSPRRLCNNRHARCRSIVTAAATATSVAATSGSYRTRRRKWLHLEKGRLSGLTFLSLDDSSSGQVLRRHLSSTRLTIRLPGAG